MSRKTKTKIMRLAVEITAVVMVLSTLAGR